MPFWPFPLTTLPISSWDAGVLGCLGSIAHSELLKALIGFPKVRYYVLRTSQRNYVAVALLA